jgi:hypothetical protein
MVDAGGKNHVYTAADLGPRSDRAAVIVMRFIVYAIVFGTSFTVVALLIVLAIPIGTAIDCPICTNKTAIVLIALGSASAGAVLGLGTAGLYRTRADSI